MSSLMLITRYIPPVRNGLADHSALLINCLKDDFERIVVVHEVSESIKKMPKRNTYDSAKIDYVPFTNLGDLRRIVLREIENYEPDVIVLQYVPHMWGRAGIAPKVALLMVEIRARLGVPLLTFVHETYYDWSWSLKRSIVSIIHRLQLFVIGTSSDRIVVTNELRRRLLSRLWSQKIARIPAGNVSGRKPNQLRRRVHDWPYILWYGTLSEGQRLEELFSAFIIIASRFPTLRLLLVGGFDVSCERICALRALCPNKDVASRVIVQGFVEDDELSDLISGSALNVHVNHSGPSGRRTVVAAYLRGGKPMICIDGRETDPEFRHMENVVLVPDRDAISLAESLQLVMSDKSLGADLAFSAQTLYRERYSDAAVRTMVLSQTTEILREPSMV